MAIRYVDFALGNDANGGTSFADAWKTLKTGSMVANDEIRVAKSPDPVQMTGITATFTHLNKTITLNTSVTQVIAACDTSWTGQTSCTSSTGINYKEGTAMTTITNAASWAGGKMAYFATGTLNLSGYKQVSLWLYNNNAVAFGAGDLKLKLYSDATGTTEVLSLDFPAIVAATRWQVFTFNYNAALPTIQSVGLYSTANMGSSKTLWIDNIIACKDATDPTCITHHTLLGRSAAAMGNTEGWWAIRSIVGTAVTLEGLPGDMGATTLRVPNESGADESGVQLYKREPILMTPVIAQATALNTLPFNWYLYGGYNTTNNTQDGETWISQQNGYGMFLYSTIACTGMLIDHFGFVRMYVGVDLGNANCSNTVIGDIYSTATSYPVYSAVVNIASITLGKVVQNGGVSGIYSSMTGLHNWYVDSIYARACTNQGIGNSNTNTNWSIRYALCYGCGTNGIEVGPNATIQGGALRFNTSYGLSELTTGGGNFSNIRFGGNTSGSYTNALTVSNKWTYFNNCLFGDATEVAIGNVTTTNNKVFSTKHDQTADNHWIFSDLGCNINSQTATRHTASGIAWKFTVAHAGHNYNNAMKLSVGKILCQSGTPVTVTLWFQKSHASIGAALVVKGGQIAGVDADLVSTMSDTTGAWEQESLTFTPTEMGVVEIQAIAWAKTGATLPNYVYVDDLGVS